MTIRCFGRILIAVACMASVPALRAIDFGTDSGIVLHGFQTRGTDPQNRTRWALSGATATMKDALYELQDFKLTLYLENGQKAVMTSPNCTFDQARGIAQSTAPLRVVSEGMTLSGIGYDVLIKEKRIRVRSHVRMTIKTVAGLHGPLGTLPGVPAGAGRHNKRPVHHKTTPAGEK